MDERHLTATLSVIGEVQPQGEGASSSCKYTPMSGKFWFGIKKKLIQGRGLNLCSWLCAELYGHVHALSRQLV